jgi:uncharacterized protein (DUF362 family)
MTTSSRSTVALVKGPDRYGNIRQALALLGEKTISGRNHIVKPNFVSTRVQLAATHREAARAVIDHIREESGDPVTIAEGAAASDTFEGYEHFGFTTLAERYRDVQLLDLNRDVHETVTLYDEELRPQSFRIAKTIKESDHRISLAIPKTHDAAVVTLSLKNLVVGSLIRDVGYNLVNLMGGAVDRLVGVVPSSLKPLFSFQGLSRIGITKFSGSDKVRLHQGYLRLHLFLYQLVRILRPHLSVLDGFTAMEGNGPVLGNKVDWGVAIVGTDGVAVDTVAAYLMGFDPQSIGYLSFCRQDGLGEGNIDAIKIVGTPLEKCLCRFKRHQSYEAQLSWEEEGEVVFRKLKEHLDTIGSSGAGKAQPSLKPPPAQEVKPD